MQERGRRLARQDLRAAGEVTNVSSASRGYVSSALSAGIKALKAAVPDGAGRSRRPGAARRNVGQPGVNLEKDLRLLFSCYLRQRVYP